ncbi:hypothetical protein [Paractinoplanes rishiriensis]|nr:hypothetical protein [Actinoplanes rishiriensis]
MLSYQLTEALAEVPGVEATIRRGLLHIHVPELGDTASLDPDDVIEANDVFVPTKKPAVQLDIKRGREVVPLIVTVGDLVFTPTYADSVLAPGAAFRVPAMPGLIAYSEMHRDVRALGKAIDDPALDPETLAATLLAHRCFLRGATRVGLWPVRVAAWWEYSYASAARRIALPDFRPDEEWDDLMASVAEAREQQSQSPV